MADTLVIRLAEDAWNGDAQFTLDLDGVQIAGPTAVTTAHGTGFQEFTYTGDYGAGPHTVAVHFINDAWGGTASTDRNLYVDGIVFDGTAYDGQTAQNDAGNGGPDSDPTAAEMRINGTTTFTNVVAGSSPPPPPPPGSDTLVLHLSEDAFNGDAQFAVFVDGVQVGGPTSVTTAHGSGVQDVTFTGNFGAGPHSVDVRFLNDAWGGTTTTDRNLYVHGITFDGVDYAGQTAQNTASNGGPDSDPNAAEMRVNGDVIFSNVGGSSPPPPPPPGSDTLVLHLSEDAWNADAQFAVFVDGVKIAGPVSVTTHHGSGWQDFTYTGDFGGGAHKVDVQFLNDAWGGTADTDRNLYVRGITFDGVDYSGQTAPNTGAGPDTDPNAAEVFSNGIVTFDNVGGTGGGGGTPPPPSGRTSTVVVHASEDAWNGDAQFLVFINGVQQGGTQTVTASHSAGQSQSFTFTGDFGVLGPDTVAIRFINDAWGGTTSTDRNLYVQSIEVNGTTLAGSSAANDASNGATSGSEAVMAANGTATFTPIIYGDTAGNLSNFDHAAGQSLSGSPTVVGDAKGLFGHAAGGADSITASVASGPRPVAVAVGDATTITENAVGGDDTVSAQGNLFDAVAYGDAVTLSGNAIGGADSVLAVGRSTATAYGDAETISGFAQGGNDNVSAGSRFGTIAYGDAQTITDHGHGGDDIVSGSTSSSPVHAQVYGDAHTLSGFAIGGNDTITGGFAQMYGDGNDLLDQAIGGNDTLISGQLSDDMWGDAAVVAASAQTGADIFLFDRSSATALGNDVIHDFEPGKDHIQLKNYPGIASFADLQSHISDTSAGSLITFDSQNTILVANDHNLTAGDFIFG